MLHQLVSRKQSQFPTRNNYTTKKPVTQKVNNFKTGILTIYSELIEKRKGILSMIFDTLSALADYRNNLKFDNNATMEQCEEVVLELSRAQHETLTIGQKHLLNNEIDKYSYWVDGIQHKTSRTDLEPYVSNESSSSSSSFSSETSNSSSSSSNAGGPIDPGDLLFLKADNGILTDVIGGDPFSIDPPAAIEENEVLSVAGGGGVMGEGSVPITGELLTIGLWMKGFVFTKEFNALNDVFFLNASSRRGVQIAFYINLLDAFEGNVSIDPITIPNITDWNFAVVQYSNSLRQYRVGINGIWSHTVSDIEEQYQIRNFSVPLTNFLFTGTDGNPAAFNGVFITESYPEWTVLREYALASKPADAVMW